MAPSPSLLLISLGLLTLSVRSSLAVLPPDPCGIITDKPQNGAQLADFTRAGDALLSKDPNAAVEKYREACLAIDFSQERMAWMHPALQLSEALSRARRHKEAVAVAQEARVVLFPDVYWAFKGHLVYIQLSEALFRGGQREEAEQVLHAAMEDKKVYHDLRVPSARALHHQLARSLLINQKYAEAEESLRQLQQQYDKMRDRSAKDQDDMIDGLYHLGMALSNQQKFAEADAFFLRAAEMSSKQKPFTRLKKSVLNTA